MARSFLVIYYDGNQHHADFRSCDTPDSSVPRVWGLPDDYLITAVIEVHPAEVKNIWIDEESISF